MEHVEDELMFLWHMAADNMRISQNTNVRTSVLNFVICAPNVESAYKASMLLRDLASTHIARVILLIQDRSSDGPGDISIWTTLRSFSIISDVMRHHFEQITVAVSGTAVRSSASIILPLLKPDLPVYLWWLNDLPDDQMIFHRLLAISSRVIVDSRLFSTPEQRIRGLSALLQDAPSSAVSDLNWGRITPWRELIAQFFDVADYRPYLMNATNITIEHAAPSTSGTTNPLQALLLAAWLKTRLGWQRSEDASHSHQDAPTGTYSWHMTNRTAPRTDRLQVQAATSITIAIQPRIQAELPPGALCMVRITCSANGEHATFTLNRDNGDNHVSIAVDLPDGHGPQRTVYVTAEHKENDLLHDELEITGRDHLYEETLHEIFSLLT